MRITLLRNFGVTLFCLLTFLPSAVFSEGSKELYIGTNNVWLFSCNDAVGQCNNGGPRTRFASYDGPENDRLYFVKLHNTETIYLGFNGSINTPNNINAHIVFRIKNLAGTIVYPETNLPTTSTGFIANIGQARVGPTQIYGTGGYTAINFHPADTGTFFIEWTRKLDNGLIDLGGISMDLIDITVYDTVASLVKPGRLYSKSWQFQENNNCSSKTYIYSVDSIITSCEFSNMQGGIWVQFCNQWGCANTGNFTLDRKSKNSQSLLPQFKIFVNNPDLVLFPPAITLGQIIPPDPYGVQDCNTGNIVFHVNVDKPGNVAIELDFSGSYVTRTLNQNVIIGENLITWDGLDGTLPTGLPVPNGVNVTFTVKYINGLTNLPFYDVEKNPNGFTIDMVNPPAAEPPFVFWDDTGVSGGSNLTGCQSPPGCHTWSGSGQGFGNLKTINTWWYNVSATTIPITIQEWRKPGTLVFNQSPPITYCAGTSGIVFSVSPDPNTSEYHWGFTGPGAVITHANPSDPFITVNFTAATTGNITVYGSNSNCIAPSPTVNLPVTINPIPTINPIANQVVCHQGLTTTVNFTGSVTGATYTWTNSNFSIGLPGFGSGDILSFTATNGTTTPVTAMITVTPEYTNAGVTCTGTATTFTITVNPVPDVNSIPNQVLCNGDLTTAVSFTGLVPGTSFTWINDNTSIGLAASGSGDIGSFIATNSTNIPAVANITVTPTYTNLGVTCPGAPITFKITVNPTPTVDLVTNQVLCHDGLTGAISFTGLVSGTVYEWLNNTPSIGLASTGLGDIASFPVTNTTSAPVVATITVTPKYTNSGTTCTGTATAFTITVNPVPTVNTVSNQVVCHGATSAPVSFSGFVPGTTFEWINNNSSIGLAANGIGDIAAFTAINNSVIAVVSTITVTPVFINGGVTCLGTPATFTITVNPIPTVNAVNNQVLCSDAPSTPVTFSGNVTGTIYTWSNSDITIGLGPGGTDNIPSFTATNSTITPVTATINVAPTFTNDGVTCTGTSTSFSITVNPKPNVVFPVSPPNPQEVCSGANSTPVALSSSVVVPGVTYSWTAVAYDPVNPTSSITGFTTPNSGNQIPGENISSSLLTQGVIKYTVTPAFNTPGLVCPGDPMEYQTLVNPSPTVALTPSDPIGQAICSGQSSIPITFTPNVTPTIYTWQAVETVGVTGAIPSGTTDNIPAHQLTLTGPVQGHVKYKVTPSYQGGGSFTCPGGVSYSTVFVNPLPAPLITGPALTCELGPDVTYSTPNITGHSYLWNITGGTITSADNTNQITVQWGSYTASPGTLTVAETIDATGCIVTSPAYQVTLQQRPIPTLTGPLTVCEASALNVYTSDPGNFQYAWLISGGTITSGGTSGSSTATVTWTTPGANWIEVNYVNSLGCPGFPANRINVQVNPLPVSTITSAPGPDCALQQHIYQTPPDIACTYTWSATTGNVVAGQGTYSAAINWLSTGPATVSVTATYGATGCNTSSSYPTVVYPSPNPVLTSCFDVVTTQNGKPIQLKGGVPLNGEFQGSPAISFDNLTGKYWFNPGSALILPGIHPITYFAMNSYGCANTSSPVSITLLPSNSTFTCNTVFTDPRDGKQYQTALLGSQCWMKENLRYSAPSPYVSTAFSTPQTDNCTFERYCLPADASCTSFGALYQWNELMQYNDELGATRQGLCPPGWHVPSATEWQNMIDASQGNGIAGGELKDLVTAQAFHALLGGIGYLNNMWAFTNTDNPNASLYWTSSLTGNKPIARGLNAVNPSVSIYESSSANAFPVRCVKD